MPMHQSMQITQQRYLYLVLLLLCHTYIFVDVDAATCSDSDYIIDDFHSLTQCQNQLNKLGQPESSDHTMIHQCLSANNANYGLLLHRNISSSVSFFYNVIHSSGMSSLTFYYTYYSCDHHQSACNNLNIASDCLDVRSYNYLRLNITLPLLYTFDFYADAFSPGCTFPKISSPILRLKVSLHHHHHHHHHMADWF